MITNISQDENLENRISKLLSLIGAPARIKILLTIQYQATCVCHLEAALGTRQASISQHLMALRKIGLVTSHRDGRNIFYQLKYPEVIQIIEQAAILLGIQPETINAFTLRPLPDCPCPQCNPDMDPKTSCQDLPVKRLAST